MLGSNNYLGLTGDERVKDAARDALERFGTGLTGSRFLNGTLSLHLELERELADWMGTEDALVFTTGYLANTGRDRHAARPRRHRDLRLRRPRLDPRRGVDVARPHPAVPPQPARQARDDAPARRGRRRRRARGRGRRLLDGGRPRPRAGHRRALPRARRAPDGRRGARRRRARRARRGRLRGSRRGGRGRPANGHVLEVARLVRRLHRRPRRRDRLPARPVALVHVHRGGGARRDRRGAGRARDHPLGRGPAADGAGCSTTRATCTMGSRSSATR